MAKLAAPTVDGDGDGETSEGESGSGSVDSLDLSFEGVVGSALALASSMGMANNEVDTDIIINQSQPEERNCLYYYRYAWAVSRGRYARALRALGWIHFSG